MDDPLLTPWVGSKDAYTSKNLGIILAHWAMPNVKIRIVIRIICDTAGIVYSSS